MNIKYRRRSIRLKGYDYSEAGFYFVTVCAQDRDCIFGDVHHGSVRLNKIGQMVDIIWKDLPDKFQPIQLDEHVLMPNHIHGIINITVGAPFMAPHPGIKTEYSLAQGAINRAPTLGEIIRAFKAKSTRRIRQSQWPKFRWQRNYFERVIRNEAELFEVRRYIREYPLKWDWDTENPNCSM